MCAYLKRLASGLQFHHTRESYPLYALWMLPNSEKDKTFARQTGGVVNTSSPYPWLLDSQIDKTTRNRLDEWLECFPVSTVPLLSDVKTIN